MKSPKISEIGKIIKLRYAWKDTTTRITIDVVNPDQIEQSSAEKLIGAVQPPLDGLIMGSTISDVGSYYFHKATEISVHVLLLAEMNKDIVL